MNRTEELDRIWRDGLTAAASELVITGDPRARIAQRVRHRRRARRAATAASLIVLSGAAFGAVTQIGRHSKDARLGAGASATITAIVQVEDAPGNRLTIAFPGRIASGNPPSLALPGGLIRFEIHGTPGHSLVIDGVSAFVADFTPTGDTTITQDVQLAPGQYLMHCTIPGHAEAGEEALLRVSTQGR